MAMRELSEVKRGWDDEEEVWVKHYSSNHQILLVGEGDFSFSRSLATLFGSASNICASSLDSYDNVVRKYKKARSNLETLKRLGAFLLHGVDATTLQYHPDLRYRRFDRIIFNFPHAGFHGKETDSSLIRKHRELVFGFFHGASRLLRADGEVHVSHKNKAPFCNWNLEELASRCFLVLIQRVAFEKSNYPGYENKRGDGSRCDKPFLLGECSTFKFKFSRVAKELYAEKVRWREVKEQESSFPQGFVNLQPVPFDHGYAQQTEFHGVSQRTVSFDLSYRRDYNLRQVQDPCVQSRQRTSPLDLCYEQEHRYSQFEDPHFARVRNHAQFHGNSLIELEEYRYIDRSSLPFQDAPFQTNHRHQEQSNDSSNRLNGVPLNSYEGMIQRMLKRTRFPHLYAEESPERHRLLCQDLPVQASQEPLFECFNRSSGVSHESYGWEVRRMSTSIRFPYPYTGESQEESLTRQSYLNIHPPRHWIR
ncbi:heavy metal-associated isoprenylated plant protein 41 isoform X1 [Capsella rubella]|uniref:heavy metal-associated isoprenylated plant protein 41 isoform X1 n=1 Tax=Capsella rubella TaxID=81985 RepID=UPI000CD5149D|nr:heavy metal-associated isoprenylated plant protein 41 isoform X1 [Capsella rubella]